MIPDVLEGTSRLDGGAIVQQLRPKMCVSVDCVEGWMLRSAESASLLRFVFTRVTFTVSLDTGASRCFVSPTTMERLQSKVHPQRVPIHIG